MRLPLVVLLCTILYFGNCINYCEVQSSEVKLFLLENQTLQLPLDKYIRGYDLDFTSLNKSAVQIYQPYHVTETAEVTIKAGYTIVNVDGRNSDNHLWGREGILFAQGGQKNVSVGYGKFTSSVLPKIDGYNYYELPYVSNCYSGLIYNQNLDVVIDCQKTTANPEQQTDLICLTFKSGNLKCKSFSSITKTSKRKSLIYTTASRQFLITATLTDHISSKFQNQTFVTVYYISDDGIEFNLLIDRRTLGLYSLSIADIDIVTIHSDQYILLTDVNSKLIAFKYNADNQIEDIKTFVVEGSPRQFVESSEGTWLIANEKYILDCTFSHDKGGLQVLRKYELDPADNHITDLQSSFLFVVARTFLGHLYTYSRKYTQLKYLLNRQDITESTSVVVSPFYPRFFQINNTKMSSIAISSGHIYVTNIKESTQILVIGHSGNTSCPFSIKVQLVKDSASKIYQKKVMTSAYRVPSSQQVKFILSDYFGGSNLNYDVKASDKIQYRKQHINKYTQTLPGIQNDEILYTKVIEIDNKNYYLAVFKTSQAVFYKCNLKQNSQTSCEQIDERIKFDANQKFAHADGLMRSNGKAYVAWSFAPNSNTVMIKEFGKNGRNILILGESRRFSQVLVADKYFVFIEKQLSRLCFYDNSVTFGIECFSKNDFNQAQIASMGGGFYPRQIFDSHNNPHIFFFKFPIAVVAFSYSGDKNFQILSYHAVSETYIPDGLWQMVIGRETMLLFTTQKISQYAILTDGSLRFLHEVPLNKKPIFPVRYELSTDTAFFECEDGTIQYIRLNQPALDSVYYDLKLEKVNSGGNWDVSGSWLVSTSGQVFYQYEQPALYVVSNLPDSSFTSTDSISLIVSNEVDQKKVQANITAYNYPIKIEQTSAEDNGLTLPQKGDNTIISFPVDKHFKGPISDYRIVCTYCLDGSILLLSPVRLLKQNQQLKYYDSIVGLPDGTGAIVVKKKNIYIVDLSNNVVSTEVVDIEGECNAVAVNEGNVIVFCVGLHNQELFWYTVQNRKLTLYKSYFIPAQGLVFRASEIGVHLKGNVLTVFIHDVDLMNPGAKDSNIKVFELSEGTIKFIGQIDSGSFSQLQSAPINSMSIHKDDMLVTIGGQGVGYLDLTDSKISGSFIDLENQPTLKEYTLDDTAYLRVVISARDADKINALVTTSNSYNYVFQFLINNRKATFSRQLQIYKRYGHQKSLNWGLIDSSYVMLSFYNTANSVQTLAVYKRSGSGLNDFFSAVHYVVPASDLKPPKAALVHSGANSFLYRDNADKPAAEGSLSLYNVTHEFSLLLTYEKPSSFQTIQVTASNDYSSATKQLSVKFDGTSDGVKWYSIVIVVVLIAIAVGVAFGFYLRMKKKKADSKKVSLFTENEEVDEQV